MATKFIDLNCDMGESYGRWTLGADEEIMPFITSANVACGFHGGDPHVMRKTVELALRHSVAIGSHPSLPDLMGFGRRVMDVTPAELKDYLCYQTGALREYCRAAGAELQHMKPHGILYTMIEKQPDQALVHRHRRGLDGVGQGADPDGAGLRALRPDRAQDGRARRLGGLRRPRLQRRPAASSRASSPARSSPIRSGPPTRPCGWRWRARSSTIDGVDIDISVQTICCHGDTPGAQHIVRAGARGARPGGLPGQAAPLKA